MLFLVTQAYETAGGIPTYMRRIAEILTAYCGQNGRGDGLSVISLQDSRPKPTLHSNPVVFREFLTARGSKAQFLIKTMFCAFRHRSDVMVVGHVTLARIALILKAFHLIRAYIILVHGVEAWGRKDWLTRIAAQRACGIIAISKFTKERFVDANGIDHQRSYVIPLALAEAAIDPPQGRRVGVGTVVLTVGRLDRSERYKGTDDLIEAVIALYRDGEAIELRIVGTGNDSDRLKRKAREMGGSDCIRFLGPVEQAELTRCYRACSVFAMPSKKEGFGLVFIEAMSHGKPCIGGNHGGTPEVIQHGKDGYLVEYGDKAELRRYLHLLCTQPGLAEQMGQHAYERVRRDFLFPVMCRRWCQTLDIMLLALTS